MKNKSFQMLACLLTIHHAVEVNVEGSALSYHPDDHDCVVAVLRSIGIEFTSPCPGMALVNVDSRAAVRIDRLTETLLSTAA